MCYFSRPDLANFITFSKTEDRNILLRQFLFHLHLAVFSKTRFWDVGYHMRGVKTCLFSKGEYSTPLDNLTFLRLYMQFSPTNAASKGQEMKCQKSEQSEKVYVQMKSSIK